MATLPRRLSGVLKSVVRDSKGARATARVRARRAALAAGMDIAEPRVRGGVAATAATGDALALNKVDVIKTFCLVRSIGREKTEFLHDRWHVWKPCRVSGQCFEAPPFRPDGQVVALCIKLDRVARPVPVQCPGRARRYQGISIVGSIRENCFPCGGACGTAVPCLIRRYR